MNEDTLLRGACRPWDGPISGLGPITLPDWQSASDCSREVENGASPDLWYAAEGTVEAEQAKAICNGCPVQTECLALAMENGEVWGIWGAVQFEPIPEVEMCSKGLHEMVPGAFRFKAVKGKAYKVCRACHAADCAARRAA